MSRKLRAYVHVAGKVYGPGDEVPAKVAKQIGAHAWEDADTATAMQAPKEPETVEEPRRSGPGSGIDAWRKFAEKNGVEYATDASRETVIAACEDAGVIEPEPPKE